MLKIQSIFLFGRLGSPGKPFAVPCVRLADKRLVAHRPLHTLMLRLLCRWQRGATRPYGRSPAALWILSRRKESIMPLMHFFCGGRPILQARQKHP